MEEHLQYRLYIKEMNTHIKLYFKLRIHAPNNNISDGAHSYQFNIEDLK